MRGGLVRYRVRKNFIKESE